MRDGEFYTLFVREGLNSGSYFFVVEINFFESVDDGVLCDIFRYYLNYEVDDCFFFIIYNFVLNVVYRDVFREISDIFRRDAI